MSKLNITNSEIDFRTYMRQEVILADGGLGSLLHDRGVASHGVFEELNLSHRDVVQKLHLDYLLAGARLIETNTYGANRLKLAEAAGLADKVWDINVWGAKIARSAREISGEPSYVAGAVGPLYTYPYVGTPIAPEQMRALFREQMEGLLAGGVDLFLIETMADPYQAIEAVRAAREISKLPVVLQFSFCPDTPERIFGREQLVGSGGQFTTAAGFTPQAIAEILNQLPPEDQPDILGANCGSGPTHLVEVLKLLQAAVTFPVGWSIMPNAGLPAYTDGHVLYSATAAYFATMMETFIALGVNLIGGCCGTTPAHIAAMRQELDQISQRGTQEAPGAEAVVTSRTISPLKAPVIASIEPLPAEAGASASDTANTDHTQLSSLADKLGRRFVISVELDPPKGPVVTKLLQAATALKEVGVDAINVADSPMARVRMGAIASACLIQNQVGVESIIHLTTRDRNLMGLQSDLLGAHALGIRHVLALTGDPPSLGNSNATAVYDVDSIGLMRVITQLNQGQDLRDNPIGQSTEFTIGCALNPNAENLEREIERLQAKIASGAQYVMTQPVYDIEALTRVLDRMGGCPIPILIGVMPLHSFKHAEYLHNEVPGIQIPDSIRHELKLAGDDGLRVGLEQAAQHVADAMPYAAGMYVVLSFGKHEPICEFVKQVKRQVDQATASPNAKLPRRQEQTHG